jgi:hypothetical protein
MDVAIVPPPHAHQIAVIPAVDSVAATDDRPPPEPCMVDGDLQLTSLLADDDTPPGFTPPRPSTPLRGPAAATGATNVSGRHDPATDKLEAFVANVTEVVPTPLLDMPPRRRRVDPVLIDAPPQLPSSEASGLRRSRRQALDPLSVVKPAKRGTMLLARRLGEVGVLGEVRVPPASVVSAEEAVDNFFREGPPPRRMEALQALFPMLKNKTKISPVWDGASIEG